MGITHKQVVQWINLDTDDVLYVHVKCGSFIATRIYMHAPNLTLHTYIVYVPLLRNLYDRLQIVCVFKIQYGQLNRELNINIHTHKFVCGSYFLTVRTEFYSVCVCVCVFVQI